MSVVGPIARTVAEARFLLDVIAGPDPSDPGSLNVPRLPMPRATPGDPRAAAGDPRAMPGDPRATPVPGGGQPTTSLTSGSALGVQYIGSTVDNDVVELAIPPATLAGRALRTVDVYSVATYGRVADTTGVAAVFHYDGSWTFAADATGRATLVKTELPTEQHVADTVALLPR